MSKPFFFFSMLLFTPRFCYLFYIFSIHCYRFFVFVFFSSYFFVSQFIYSQHLNEKYSIRFLVINSFSMICLKLSDKLINFGKHHTYFLEFSSLDFQNEGLLVLITEVRWHAMKTQYFPPNKRFQKEQIPWHFAVFLLKWRKRSLQILLIINKIPLYSRQCNGKMSQTNQNIYKYLVNLKHKY